MACYKLSSCTAGNTTILWSTQAAWSGFVGGPAVSLSNHGGTSVAYTVELIEAPCPCGPDDPTVNTSFLIFSLGCNSPNTCYKLMECNNALPPIYVSNNLNPYIGLAISVAEYPGHCFNVVGVSNPVECDANLPVPVFVTCVTDCVCGVFCYQLTNCVTNAIITINSTLVLVINHVVALTPSIIPQGGNNCWTVTGDGIPCVPTNGTTVTAVIDYGINGCVACAPSARCYLLTNCDNSQTVYSQSNLLAFLGLVVTIPSLPGTCWLVSDSPITCTNPVPIDPLTVILNCNCPCYSLRNCKTQQVIQTNSNLAAFIGQSVHLTEFGGCAGDCWLVSLNQGPCTAPQVVTVTLGCVPCAPCDQTCYDLVDCLTNVVFTTLTNPTTNAVDLSTLVGGQTVGQINILGVITNGCWYVRLNPDCAASVSGAVSNIYASCNACTNSCYGLLNCKTLAIDYVIKYTTPNPHGLPNPSTLSGAIGSLCFDAPVGCVTGCYQLQLIPGVSCVGSVDWTTVVSMTPYKDCFDCSPPCYLLTECAPAVSTPIVVNNDLSLYVGQVAKICSAAGVCHCYHVELAQSCDNAITIDNANASFTTCEECNSCACPPGYTKVGTQCQKITSIPATVNPVTYVSAPGSVNALYGNLGTNFYTNITPLPFPLTAVGSQFKDAALVVVPKVTNTVGVWGGPAGSRLNTIGIWTTALPNPVNEWIGFSECIDIPTTGTYCIGIGGDDCVRIKIDGVLAVEACVGFFDFNYWHVFEINLTAGTHIIVLEGKSVGGPASFAAEIYNVTSATLQTYTTSAQVQLATIFSTFPKRATPTNFQTGETSGFSCPPGYTFNNCGAPTCSLIETIPFVVCPRTFLVTDCEGEEQPYYTNTDLSSYIGGVYKTCIPAITYSTSCFILKDCNRLSPDIVTNTILTSYLWQTVSLEGHAGSCFIVTGVPAGQICVGAIPVLILDVVPCVCPGAQQPWFPRCYCVTVEEVFPTITAPDFTGVFTDTPYECCTDCTRTCYTLTSCVGGIAPVLVCNDLAQYVGQVIQIASCGDICWQVAIAPNCTGSITFAGTITAFTTCVACLPPAPPIPPPYDLHLRKIKPGWKSPNKCYTLEYIEKINCSFGQQIYNEMLVARYGITVCCEDDVTKWDILKQMLDLDMLKDPSLCKSTLCCCPAPCFIDAFVTLLPFCGAPNIVSVLLNVPCPAPVLIGTEIVVQEDPAICYCWKVDYDITQPPLTLYYIDCCCVVQTYVIDISGEGSVAICSATAPVSFGDPIVVTNMGLCGTAALCNPPPPQICSCWIISNIGKEIGNFTVNAVCPSGPFGLGMAGSIPPGSPPVYVCSIAPPIIDANLSAVNSGDCDGYCGPTPPACVCYEIAITNPAMGCTFNYIDCNGIPVIDYLPPAPLNYICAQTMPVSNNCGSVQPAPFTISSTPFNCVNGQCGPPLPCDCYMVVVSGATAAGVAAVYSYWDCTGVWHQYGVLDGVYSACSGSGAPYSIDPNVSSYQTLQDCALGECIEPYTTCLCYEIFIPADGINYTVHHVDCNGTPINEVFNTPIGGPGVTYRRCAQLLPTSPTLNPLFITVNGGLNCATGTCIDPPPPVACDCYSYQIVGGSGIIERQDYTDCTGSPAQIAGVSGQTGFVCAQSIGGFSNPNILMTAMAPGAPGCASAGC